jgi:hypothetical protein
MRVIAALLLTASVSFAQEPSASLSGYRNRIVGVFDFATGEPIEGAEIVDLMSGTKALTTKTGTVSLIYLPDGGSLVRIRKFGYSPLTKFFAISPADTVPLTIMLVSAATVLPAVVTTDSAPHWISPGLRAFEERRKSGFGHFITEAELRKSDAREMSDVMRSVSGVSVGCSTRTPRRCVAGSFRMGGTCPFAMYIDGIRSSDINLLMLQVGQFAGVEVYSPATVPPQYNSTGGGSAIPGSSTCGVVLFWSRER